MHMGLLSSSGSYSVFSVKDDLPKDFNAVFTPMVERHAFQPIQEMSDQESSAGWVRVENPFRSDFAAGEFITGDFIVLSFRTDRRAVPQKLLRHHLMQAETRYRAETGRDRLSKTERKEIAERVKAGLMRKVLPSIHTCDMVWDMKRGRVLVTSVVERTCQDFSEQFEATFGLGLIAGGIYLMLKGIIRWEISLTFLIGVYLTALLFNQIDPVRFVGPGVHILSGYTLLGAFFLATDDSSSPVNTIPMLIYGVAGGIMTVLIRNIGAYIDGVILAILVINLVNPLLDKIRPQALGKVV